MRKSDVSQPVIDKCRELAEHWRMGIYEGCWVARAISGDLSGTREYKIYQVTWLLHKGFQVINTTHGLEDMPIEYYPIPSISDVLSKLKEMKILDIELIQEGDFWTVWFFSDEEHPKGKTCNTLHEALLSALLEILKGRNPNERHDSQRI